MSDLLHELAPHVDELAIFPDDPDWQAQLRKIAHDLRLLALRHPNVVPLLVTRPLSTPLGMRPLGLPQNRGQLIRRLVPAEVYC